MEVSWDDRWRHTGRAVGFIASEDKDQITLTCEVTDEGLSAPTIRIPKRYVKEVRPLRRK